MEVVFDTNNSRYYIDTNLMTWKRDKTARSGNLLGIEAGPLVSIPDIIVGERCLIAEGPSGHLITIHTSPVRRILRVLG